MLEVAQSSSISRIITIIISRIITNIVKVRPQLRIVLCIRQYKPISHFFSYKRCPFKYNSSLRGNCSQSTKYQPMKSNVTPIVEDDDTFLNKSLVKDTKNKAGISENHTNLLLNKLNPYFVTGFTDGEGSFIISVTQDSEYSLGFRVKAIFRINLHKEDLELLKLIQSYFDGAGNIREDYKGICSYTFNSLDEICNILIPHFDKYPLISQKLADYLLFRKAVMLIKNKSHLTEEGFKSIIGIKAFLNRGLNEELKATFPKNIPVERPVVVNQVITDPQWLAGFISAEGNFFLNVYKAKTKTGSGVKLVFRITQHIRDELLIRSFIQYFGCGKVYKKTGMDAVDFMVTGLSDITDKVVPFLCEYPVLGKKSSDFKDFCVIAELMKDKKHLTSEGLKQILSIKAGMNTGRQFPSN